MTLPRISSAGSLRPGKVSTPCYQRCVVVGAERSLEDHGRVAFIGRRSLMGSLPVQLTVRFPETSHHSRWWSYRSQRG